MPSASAPLDRMRPRIGPTLRCHVTAPSLPGVPDAPSTNAIAPPSPAPPVAFAATIATPPPLAAPLPPLPPWSTSTAPVTPAPTLSWTPTVAVVPGPNHTLLAPWSTVVLIETPPDAWSTETGAAGGAVPPHVSPGTNCFSVVIDCGGAPSVTNPPPPPPASWIKSRLSPLGWLSGSGTHT